MLPFAGQESIPQGLNVVSQQVVDIDSSSADGRHLIEASMWPMPVVLVDPGFEVAVSFC